MPSLTDAQVRHWLENLHAPERLADPTMRDLLQAHGRPSDGSTAATAREASGLLLEKIEALKAPEGAKHVEQRPYMVLTGFRRRQKLWQMANAMSLSERQATRERTRAVALLRAELEATP